MVRPQYADAHRIDTGSSRALRCARVRGWRLLASDARLAPAGDHYRLLDQQGRDLGALVAPLMAPLFGRSAPTVFLQRDPVGNRDRS